MCQLSRPPVFIGDNLAPLQLGLRTCPDTLALSCMHMTLAVSKGGAVAEQRKHLKYTQHCSLSLLHPKTLGVLGPEAK